MKNLKKHLDKQFEEQLDKVVKEALKGMLDDLELKEKKEESKKDKEDNVKKLVDVVGEGATLLASVLGEAHDSAVALITLTAVLAAFDDIGEKLDYQRARKDLLSAITEFHNDIENSVKLLSREK